MSHVPVMMKEVLEYLDPKPGDRFVDGTLGDGGHAMAIVERSAPGGKVLGLDWDPVAVAECEVKIEKSKVGDGFVIVNANFKEIASVVAERKFGPVRGILLDLGFSSSTLERGRGFSFEKDEPLDMRFNVGEERQTAADIVNGASTEELEMIFREYGEEKLASLIARAIVGARRKSRIIRTLELSEVVLEVYRQKLKSKKKIPWIGGLHPATRVFQALRIAVNEELANIQETLPEAIEVLAPGGRLAVITFHSLEDRIVKHFFKGEDKKSLKILTKRPIPASEQEIAENPRARSAKLRVVEKLA
ncbi:MAG: 16S rRNA (cytosine(1402)-N(4))-methyltransferase RsmH [Patescibacteria group bacterium]